MRNVNKLATQADVFNLPVPKGKAEAVYFDEGKPRDRAPGLALRVREGGSRKFVFFCRVGGKQQKYTIGDASSWTLDKARDKARTLRVQVDNGENPAALARVSVATPVTLGETVTKYLIARGPTTATSDKRRLSGRSFLETKRYLSEYWKPLHSMALGDVTRQHVTNRLDELAADKGPPTADRARTALSGLYAWSMEGDDKLSNPVMGSRRHGDNDPRERVLTDDELVAIWNASDPTTPYGGIVRMLMLTGCRRNEISALRWSEIHALDTPGQAEIRLPGERTKNGQPHTVPLSAPAVALLSGIVAIRGRDMAFGRGANGYSAYALAKRDLDAKMKLDHWTLHDIRRTVRTRLGSLGVQPHIAEAILNHLPPRLIRTYDRNPYGTEKRHALDTWAGYLQAALARAEGGNVVSIRA